MSFKQIIVEYVPPWVIDESWLVHFALVAALLAIRLVPIVLAWAVKFLGALAQLLFAALLVILPAAATGLGRSIPVATHGVTRLSLLLWFILLEAGQGRARREDEEKDPVTPRSDDDGGGIAAACARLGLPIDGFGEDDLKRAYREAIKRAHPDQGGSAAETRAVMRARERIRQHFGWKGG